ncbi:LapA family protein [Gordonia neofelifaecis]|uniref:Lipopolysaccharide assembly protein A domain-containing protein n=1 Tax=Gordonia neofelifaecis NRRL B-59395 TaxID=644548 RepID=F1YIC4_9ACTN|nr:lipopolysaccharide assembly protein LapA domain-containing protein [Gordonia neofelifaecis]EGD55678.1 hypothetical protein SCNU_08193 [Gordonia neofelifaecis NRRL B-59395]
MTTPDRRPGDEFDESAADPQRNDTAPMDVPQDHRVDDPVEAERRRVAAAASAASGTRTQATYVGWVVGVIITILLIVFILVNLATVQINFIFFKADLPIGVSLLIAAIAGALITALLGGARIFQLNRALKKAGKRK